MPRDFAKISHPKKRAFLKAFAETGVILRAARAAKVDRHSHQNWLKDDPAYAAAFEEAKEDAGDLMEEEARRRAITGLRRLKFYNGNPVIDPATKEPYFEHEYSDTLLIFLMKGARPAVYRDNFKFGMSNDGKSVTFSLNIGGGDEPTT